MPTRRVTTKNTTSESNSDSISIRVPKLTFLKNGNYTPVLVALLIVFSFIIGVLFTKVSYLEGGNNGTAANNQQAAASPVASTAPAGPVNVAVGGFPAQGDTNAKVTVIEFADFRCPFCEQLFTNVTPSLKKDYIDTGKVKFYFRNYAFLGPASTVAANAGECANEQGKFWDMHDWFYKNQPPETDTSIYTVDNLTQVAGTLGMDTTKFQDCLSSNKYQSKVDQDMKDGTAAGVNGTPATFVNGVLISGAVPYEQFKSAIDAALAK